MSTSSPSPENPEPVAHYQVVCSGRVLEGLRQLLLDASARAIGQQVRDAVREIHRRLTIYPQFGEARRDLTIDGQTEWTACHNGVAVRYVIDEANRAVYVVTPFVLLPNAASSAGGPPRGGAEP